MHRIDREPSHLYLPLRHFFGVIIACALSAPSPYHRTLSFSISLTSQVRLNGYALTPLELRRLSGYVVQEDILPAMLTVCMYVHIFLTLWRA
jgi:hypothetical protein